ncbi:hypothetical protein DFP72DRAFT_882097 [Ephemerocybe angulata]|uniref:Uncharacterized protein n=1 Tax=Ephemerocybe angulata TaxID=980116 RepID=A0A8H6I7M4_9AGAR|nr:hypothetical protein DFP72DRAFT_882097 [Tulosesus angulatus]
MGELSHRLPKQWYPRTDKRNYEGQMAQIERRQARLARIRERLSEEEAASSPMPGNGAESPPAPPPGSLNAKYSIGQSEDEIFDLTHMFMMVPMRSTDDDPYLQDFLPKLKQHLLPRIYERLGFQKEQFEDSAWESVIIPNNRLYHHKIMRANYTTYDVRRSEDIIHVDTDHSNVMLLNAAYNAHSASIDDNHPYLYAKVLGVFHINTSLAGLLPDGTRQWTPARIEFLWVRWYEVISAPTPYMLDRLRLRPLNSPDALQFIDPADVLRGVHVVPRFSAGQVDVPELKSRWVNNDTRPWNEYYLNRFADRDLFMRFQYGMSVGHTYMRGMFPPPSIPEIPPDFDHCILRPTPRKKAPKKSGQASAPLDPTLQTPLQVPSTNLPVSVVSPQASGSGGPSDPNVATAASQASGPGLTYNAAAAPASEAPPPLPDSHYQYYGPSPAANSFSMPQNVLPPMGPSHYAGQTSGSAPHASGLAGPGAASGALLPPHYIYHGNQYRPAPFPFFSMPQNNILRPSIGPTGNHPNPISIPGPSASNVTPLSYLNPPPPPPQTTPTTHAAYPGYYHRLHGFSSTSIPVAPWQNPPQQPAETSYYNQYQSGSGCFSNVAAGTSSSAGPSHLEGDVSKFVPEYANDERSDNDDTDSDRDGEGEIEYADDPSRAADCAVFDDTWDD